ncbi:hypothetical protein AZE42_03703 [Rhizopogon vesiculosus]|uniref:Uncharacterized protein n=1 Tax=Rhizopogon vesiculosus TaxID=180088 RepID=A0A1J8Q073_9AGAM|nr:hypothetical protein AZE42_03703 [Rhizopogon vesiculosus]
MSEASSYHRDYRSNHPETHYYVDPREHSSTPVRRNRYDSPGKRIRDVSWISAGQPQPTPSHDPHARWYPPPEPPELSVPPSQVHSVAHSSPLMWHAPTPAVQGAPSPMIGEFMTVEDPEDEEEEEEEMLELQGENDYGDNEEDIDFEFPDAPENRTGGRKGARRWVGGFVQSLRKFPGLRKSSRRPPFPSDAVFSSASQYENEPQFPTISSLNLRPLTPSLIAQTVEFMDMPEPQVHQPPSPQHHLHPHSHAHRPPPPASSSPVYSPGVDVVPQVLSTVDERSNEQTGTQERPHSSDRTHSSHTHTPHTRAHSHSSHSHRHSQSQNHSSHSTARPVINDTNPQTAPSPWKPSTATVTDYITVPPPSPPSPPPTRLKRFLHNLDQLPWVESEQIVDAYFPGRSSRHRRHTNSHVDGWKPASSWYNRRHDSLPIGMAGPNSAAFLYGQIQKGYSQPEMGYPQFPHGYAPAQPVFVYPSAFPPPGTYGPA